MDKAGIATVVSQYPKKDRDGKELPISDVGRRLLERTQEMLEKGKRL